MRVVLDTNVVVSGLLNIHGTCAAVLRLALGGKIEVALDARIMSEYHEVLTRSRFPFDKRDIEDFLEGIRDVAIFVSPVPLRKRLPDPGDDPLLETALASRADFLVTGNIKHFPTAQGEGSLEEIIVSHRGRRGARQARREEGAYLNKVCNRRATQPAGMHRRPNVTIISERRPKVVTPAQFLERIR